MSNRYKTVSYTNIGHREENQDCYKVFNDDESALIIVADGMGGLDGGTEAALTAINITTSLWDKRHSYKVAEDFLNTLCININHSVLNLTPSHEKSPGTTVAIFYIINNSAISIHAGDSRIIQLDKSTVIKRTMDHSQTELHRAKGKISEDEMSTHPDQNKLMEFMGAHSIPDTDVEHWNIEKGNNFIICSDGFWELYSSNELTSLFLPSFDKKSVFSDIQNRIDNKSKHDNTTAVFLTVSPTHVLTWQKPLRLLPYILVIMLLLISYFILSSSDSLIDNTQNPTLATDPLVNHSQPKPNVIETPLSHNEESLPK